MVTMSNVADSSQHIETGVTMAVAKVSPPVVVSGCANQPAFCPTR